MKMVWLINISNHLVSTVHNNTLLKQCNQEEYFIQYDKAETVSQLSKS